MDAGSYVVAGPVAVAALVERAVARLGLAVLDDGLFAVLHEGLLL
jgi:hypothetical protein